jgi:hypothetical protein
MDRPLTKADLVRGCELAIQARKAGGVDIAGTVMTYDQTRWGHDPICGTACCIHGFARLTSGVERDYFFIGEEDYVDTNSFAAAALKNPRATPEWVLRILAIDNSSLNNDERYILANIVQMYGRWDFDPVISILQKACRP